MSIYIYIYIYIYISFLYLSEAPVFLEDMKSSVPLITIDQFAGVVEYTDPTSAKR